jgi:hypothetical protein
MDLRPQQHALCGVVGRRRHTPGPRHLGATAPSRWLFPGGQPGRSISTALFRLATEIPAAILARTLGISVSSAVRGQQLSSQDWTAYASEVRQRTR